MTFVGYTPDSDAGRVRLLIDDTTDTDQVFTNDEIDAFLSMNGGSVKRAAAQALLMIASSEARLGKKIRTQDLSTDGPAVAAELRAQAKQLRAEADADDAAGDDANFFHIVEYPAAVTRPELTEWPSW